VRRPLLLVTAAATLLVLTGCTSAGPAHPTGSPSPGGASSAVPSPAPTATSSASPAETRYLTITGEADASLASIPDATRLALGREVCAGFAAKHSESEVATGLQNDGRASTLDVTGATVLLAASVADLCPQYRSALK